MADLRRALLTALWFAAGLAIVAAGLALSLRAGTESFLDPIFPASPVVFMAGLAVLATTGAVYELVPDRRRPPTVAAISVSDAPAAARPSPR